MNRKQAILHAIEILSQDNKNEQIVEKLQEIYSEMPLSYWTKESIIDSIETYACEHNDTLPYAHELTSKNNLPSNTVIKQKFGISSMNIFFKRYFPHLKQKSYHNKDYYSNIFKKNYSEIQRKLEIKSVNTKQYNEHKNKGTPNYETIVKKCGLTSYSELLTECGLKKPYGQLSVTIDIYSDEDENNEDLKMLLNDILSEYKM